VIIFEEKVEIFRTLENKKVCCQWLMQKFEFFERGYTFQTLQLSNFKEKVILGNLTFSEFFIYFLNPKNMFLSQKKSMRLMKKFIVFLHFIYFR
jgi:hypothetical protein